MKTAKALNLTVPSSLLARRRFDRVIMLFAALHLEVNKVRTLELRRACPGRECLKLALFADTFLERMPLHQKRKCPANFNVVP